LRGGNERIRKGFNIGKHIFLRLINFKHEITMFYSEDGKTWKKFPFYYETSGYHNNVVGGFLSLRTGLYACDKGEIIFRNFIYTGLD